MGVFPALRSSGKPEKGTCDLCHNSGWLRTFLLFKICPGCHAAFKRLFFPV
jgi:hypothetical protein